MALAQHGEIHDRDGRRVRVTRTKLPHKASTPAPLTTKAVEFRDELDRLSSRVRRLSIDRNNPEAFHMERSEIARRLQQLAEQFR